MPKRLIALPDDEQHGMSSVWRLIAATALTALVTGAGVFLTFAGDNVSRADARGQAEVELARDRRSFDLVSTKLDAILERQVEISERLSRLEGKVDTLTIREGK